LSDGWRETLQMPITDEQLKAAVFKGDSKLWHAFVLCSLNVSYQN
jgi:hypothetical protein